MMTDKPKKQKLSFGASTILMIVAVFWVCVSVDVVLQMWDHWGTDEKTVYVTNICGIFSCVLTMLAFLFYRRERKFRICAIVALSIDIALATIKSCAAAWVIGDSMLSIGVIGVAGESLLLLSICGKIKRTGVSIIACIMSLFLSVQVWAWSWCDVGLWDPYSFAAYFRCAAWIVFFAVCDRNKKRELRKETKHHELSLEQGLRTLKRMYDAGQISEWEYAHRKEELLKKL